jgi:Rieske 2Fe-2S family protein
MTALDRELSEQYTGLRQIEPTLPSNYYYDPSHYALELRELWFRNWIYVCRSSALAESRAFRTFTIGNQNILLVREQTGGLRAFHNTCRHRGSVLCEQSEGRLKGNVITCPYHAWTYNLQGVLVGAPAANVTADFHTEQFSLYEVALREWNGFVFINLDAAPTPIDQVFRPSSRHLSNWPMEKLVVGHVMRTTLACNWKIFWENFSECYHCPGIHPELSSLVPIYGRRMMGQYDDPNWEANRDDPDPKFRGGLRSGASTWSMDGQSQGKHFPDLTAEEQSAGHRYVTALPSFFVVGHVDYVRAVSVRPLGPEATEITAEWLFSEDTLNDKDFDIDKTIELGRLVIEQDGRACELNQKGIQSIAHQQGVLMAQEYAVHRFQQWVRDSLKRDD